MTLFARLNPESGLAEVKDSADMQTANPAARGWRPLTIAAQPVASSSQLVVDAGIVFTETTATQTWALRAKVQAELDGEAQAAELATLKVMVANLTEDIALGVTPAPTTAAQAFVHIQELKRQQLRANRAVRWLLKQQG